MTSFGLSRIGYGAWEASADWGPLNEADVTAAIHAALDAGIDWIDTAELYGPHVSEEIVGRAVAGRACRIATKVAPHPAGTGHDPASIRRAAEGSLKRLGREVIDLFQLHWPDSSVPVEDSWGAMAELVNAGLVRHIGLSNHGLDLIDRCARIRAVDAVQLQLSLVYRDNLGLIAACAERDIPVICYSPLGCGLLTGALTPATRFGDGDWRGNGPGFLMYDLLFADGKREAAAALARRLASIAQALDVTVAELAIAWVLARPGVAAAIVGSRNPRHVRSNARAMALDLSPGTLAHIDAALAA